ncbi:NADH-quinone oxidoreductase subunit L [Dyadobacter psychrophilus]|uniref:NADH-quinone oxidoreductase subunit L n=1 Tax=Dyadobacter psychrophilus TaxID=651661 RepID=A0A1T5H8Q1_9BACT|nr:NADH-quinone oxidoreductase subunit L [Dyadobacter psychrophilus]SKC16940.1 NADH-quinone oxidoreductase subunit L [Dyadobacter psychrophilus]
MSASLLILIPLLPLIGFLINGIGFKTIPKGAVGIIGTLAVVGSFVLSVMTFNAFIAAGSQPVIVPLFDWITVGNLNIPFSFQVDQLSLLMLMIITGVGSLIHIYSIGYMHHDEGFGKFFAYLNLFLFFMLLLVLGSNYVIMFIGWEGVGLCSYLLIGFWNKNTNYNNAARKAFIMNRVGDLGFLLGIFTIISTFGSVEYLEVFSKATDFEIGDPVIITITLFLFIGAMGKSAQIPLYTWLPDAMAGPTPVSALIHAATMVTAGIYMVIRSNVLYSLAPSTLEIVGIIGAATALFAASIGLLQNDIKKVLAYSTVSQLGYMFMGLGAMAYSASMFHVITHAFFKALLFLGAGSVIHAMSDEQDIRSMGGLRKKLPITFLTFLIATIAISGIPPFAGFFSKDEILAHVFEHNKLLWVIGVLGSLMTSFYMFRLLFLTFFGTFRGTHEQEHHLHESPASMTIPLIILAVLSALGGFIGVPEALHGTHHLAEFMSPLYDASRQVNPAAFLPTELSHSEEYLLMGVSVAVALVSAVVAYVMYVQKASVPAPDSQPKSALQGLVYNKYYVDELYDNVFVKPIKTLSNVLYSFGEFFIDLVVNAFVRLTQFLAGLLKKTQTGSTGDYVFAMVLGIVVILFWKLLL